MRLGWDGMGWDGMGWDWDKMGLAYLQVWAQPHCQLPFQTSAGLVALGTEQELLSLPRRRNRSCWWLVWGLEGSRVYWVKGVGGGDLG